MQYMKVKVALARRYVCDLGLEHSGFGLVLCGLLNIPVYY